ncbi:uncharacterized protein LOC124301885 [Neodiprion virginianus]|uniref:uncharacterized protein LOC124301885 n=1 Tax=Neodiprion virginianus TaxID=2961670 RepID=UPI001EE6A296|nr:uncharacterized protein LOC124301885 [Neodiprion virginianus]
MSSSLAPTITHRVRRAIQSSWNLRSIVCRWSVSSLPFLRSTVPESLRKECYQVSNNRRASIYKANPLPLNSHEVDCKLQGTQHRRVKVSSSGRPVIHFLGQQQAELINYITGLLEARCNVRKREKQVLEELKRSVRGLKGLLEFGARNYFRCLNTRYDCENKKNPYKKETKSCTIAKSDFHFIYPEIKFGP